jgi:hypothetical protein
MKAIVAAVALAVVGLLGIVLYSGWNPFASEGRAPAPKPDVSRPAPAELPKLPRKPPVAPPERAEPPELEGPPQPLLMPQSLEDLPDLALDAKQAEVDREEQRKRHLAATCGAWFLTNCLSWPSPVSAVAKAVAPGREHGVYVVSGTAGTRSAGRGRVVLDWVVTIRLEEEEWVVLGVRRGAGAERVASNLQRHKFTAAQLRKAEEEVEKRSPEKAKEAQKVELQRAKESEAKKWRHWTSADGTHSIRARYVKRLNDTVYLQKEDGSTLTVDKSKLCEEDWKWITKKGWQ